MKFGQNNMPKYYNSKPSIDLGLAKLSKTTKSGQNFSHGEIANACGCSRTRIQMIEMQALKKVTAILKTRGIKLEEIKMPERKFKYVGDFSLDY